MALSYVGQATGLGTAAVPAHSVGDLILIAAFQLDTSSTDPLLPAGYTSVAVSTAANRWRLGYKIATSTSDGSGDWGSANLVVVHVYRGADPSNPIGDYAGNAGVTSDGTKFGPLSLARPGGRSWVAAFVGADNTNSAINTPPATTTFRSVLHDTHEAAGFDTNGTVTSFALQTTAPSGTANYKTVTVEILEAPLIATLSASLAADTLTADSDQGRVANLTASLAADTIAAQAVKELSANLTASLAADALATDSAHGREATLSASLAADALAADATHGREATLSASLAADTLAADSDQGRVANLTASLDADALSADSDQGRVANLSISLGADTLVSQSAKELSANLSANLSADTLAADSDQGRVANLSISLGADTLATDAAHGREATLTASLGADTLAATSAKQLSATLAASLGADTLAATSELVPFPVLQATLDATLSADRLLSIARQDDVEPPEADEEIDRSHCTDISVLIEDGVNRILTQYRESPNLIFLMRSYMRSLAEVSDAICNMPEYFDVETAVGDQLTLLGKRLGFPRCHCICDQPPVFGFACDDNTGFSPQFVGFCEMGEWADCAPAGIADICIDDDEIYRKFLKVRRYQFLRMYDFASLQTCIETLYGPMAKIMSFDDGRVVIAPFRLLTNTEKSLLKLIPRILPVVPGIRLLMHLGVYPVIAGFGEGWGGFCDTIPPDIIKVDADDNLYLELETGIEYLAVDEYTRNAYWLCPVDVKPYSC